MNKKKGFRWWLFNRFGPPEVQNLIDFIDEASNEGENDIVIWPTGEFEFTIRTAAENPFEKPFVFGTLPERTAFQHGVYVGVKLMGGVSQAMTEEQFEGLEEMRKRSTHGDGGSFNN